MGSTSVIAVGGDTGDKNVRESDHMQRRMSRWGVGPSFASLSLGYGIITFSLSRHFYPAFQIGLIPSWFLSILGGCFLLGGIVFLVISVTALTRAYNAGTLVTDGVFSWCRHPVYAAWAVFIVPGIALFEKSWVVLTTPVFMYLLLTRLVTKEEIYLEQVFGSAYREYKEKIPRILPIGRLKPR